MSKYYKEIVNIKIIIYNNYRWIAI